MLASRHQVARNWANDVLIFNSTHGRGEFRAVQGRTTLSVTAADGSWRGEYRPHETFGRFVLVGSPYGNVPGEFAVHFVDHGAVLAHFAADLKIEI